MKKFLFIALAAMGFAACENVNEEINPGQSGDLEKSYVAISLAADDITRADDGKYVAGTDAENEVKCAFVFFFKGNEPFMVAYDDPTATTTNTGGHNYLELALTDNQQTPSAMDKVEKIKNAVLVLRNYKGEYPDKMVAVLNWYPAADAYKLSELQAMISNLQSYEDGFVMSNAVYMDGAKQAVCATPLTIEDIYKDEESAMAHPVTIHVERIAARVDFAAANNEGLFPINREIDGTDIYAKIVGFDLYNDHKQSKLLKEIDTTWTVADLGFNWNDEAWYRSYWAKSLATDFPENNFKWNTNQAVIGQNVYCGENTNAWTVNNDVRTKVIVKAQLVKNDADKTPVEVVNWFGKDYIGEDALKEVVANTLANTYYYKVGDTYKSIEPGQIKCVEPSAVEVENEESYYVYFQVATAGERTWYKYDGSNFTQIGQGYSDFNEILKNIEPALVYKNGMTYYYTDIRHLGAKADDKGYYGVVRNHVYKVNISEIEGYGTPVYNGNTIIETPEKPEDIKTHVAAEIRILSWRVVENDYPLN